MEGGRVLCTCCVKGGRVLCTCCVEGGRVCVPVLSGDIGSCFVEGGMVCAPVLWREVGFCVPVVWREVGVCGVAHRAGHGVVQRGRVHCRHRQMEPVHPVPRLKKKNIYKIYICIKSYC